MGIGILLMMLGIYFIIINHTFSAVINLKYQSKSLELGIRIFIFIFASLLIIIGLLTVFDLITVVSIPLEERSYFFIIIGCLNIITSSFSASLMLKKYSESEFSIQNGKKKLVILFVGIGIIFTMIGIFGFVGIL